MKQIAFCFLLAALAACHNAPKSDTINTETADEAKADTPGTPPPPKLITNPEVRVGIEGFYTGPFEAVEYKEGKEIYTNQITVCIDSLSGQTLYGHSIVAGNSRPFNGSFEKTDSGYSVRAAEPGDNKYDGAFEFTINPSNNLLTGTWLANDSKLVTTKRQYELKARRFMYDPKARLEEDMAGPIYNTYNEKTGKEEGITVKGLRMNASTTALKASDVENMYASDLEVVRNAIYARHGYSFRNLRMRLLFDNNTDWYMPVSDNVTAELTPMEKQNIDLIKRYEEHAKKYYDVFGR